MLGAQVYWFPEDYAKCPRIFHKTGIAFHSRSCNQLILVLRRVNVRPEVSMFFEVVDIPFHV